MKRFYLAQLAPIARVSDAPAADYGALFGVLTYAVYNFTNYSTLKDWPFAGRR